VAPSEFILPNKDIDKVATSGYIIIMRALKTVGIKELKDNLSSYLREVQRGIRIFVTDRNIIIAELHEPLLREVVINDTKNQMLIEWIEKKLVIIPHQKQKKITPTSVSCKQGTSLKLLDEEREE